VQARRTERRRRAVVDAGRQVAELAVDAVVYDLGGRAVRHHEVEVEAKAEEGAAAAAEVARALEARFAPCLRPWRHGKLRTGKAVAELLAAGRGDLLADDGTLLPVAYDAVALRLEQCEVPR
jgi:hypothetical protein